MARPEVLDRIQEAEAEADEIVAEAQSDREERIEEAREEAEEMREERLAEARAEIEQERETIVAEGQAEREALEASARERTDEVVEYVVDLFEEAVHAQT